VRYDFISVKNLKKWEKMHCQKKSKLFFLIFWLWRCFIISSWVFINLESWFFSLFWFISCTVKTFLKKMNSAHHTKSIVLKVEIWFFKYKYTIYKCTIPEICSQTAAKNRQSVTVIYDREGANGLRLSCVAQSCDSHCNAVLWLSRVATYCDSQV